MSLPSASPESSASSSRRSHSVFSARKAREAFVFGGRVAFGLAELDQGEGVVEVALDLGERAQPILQHVALAHQFLRGAGIVPEVGVFGFGVELG